VLPAAQGCPTLSARAIRNPKSKQKKMPHPNVMLFDVRVGGQKPTVNREGPGFSRATNPQTDPGPARPNPSVILRQRSRARQRATPQRRISALAADTHPNSVIPSAVEGPCVTTCQKDAPPFPPALFVNPNHKQKRMPHPNVVLFDIRMGGKSPLSTGKGPASALPPTSK
jgi:hypothetical protein